MALSKKDLQLTTFSINGNELVSLVVYTAITCKTYPTLPRKLDVIIEKVTALYKEKFQKISDDFYLWMFIDYEELLFWLNEFVLPIPEIQELNLTQKEIDAGITSIDDPRREKEFVFTSRYSTARPENEDFVDLDAYIRNLCHNLIRSCIEIDFSTFPGARYYVAGVDFANGTDFTGGIPNDR